MDKIDKCKDCKFSCHNNGECPSRDGDTLFNFNGTLILECKKYQKKIETTADNVNHPNHYLQGGRETIETIKDVTNEGFEGYLVGSIIKYISRYKYKNGIEDVKKSEWYVKKLIELLEGEK